MKKLIICCALSGSLPTKEQNPHVPITPDEIVADALAVYKAGASIVHIHARDKNGKNCHDPEIFREIHTKLKAQAPELIVQLSTGGRAGQGFESRNACLYSNPEMASLCTGSTNFPVGIYANEMELVVKLAEMMKKRRGEVFYARPEFCTDNGAMIAYAGMVRFKAGATADLGVSVRPRWPLAELPAA